MLLFFFSSIAFDSFYPVWMNCYLHLEQKMLKYPSCYRQMAEKNYERKLIPTFRHSSPLIEVTVVYLDKIAIHSNRNSHLVSNLSTLNMENWLACYEPFDRFLGKV